MTDHNVQAVLKDIEKAAANIADLKKQRAAINQEIAAEIETLESKGINRHAFRFAMRYFEGNEASREGFDIGYELARKALGVPIQMDMFQGPNTVKPKDGGDSAKEEIAEAAE